MFPSTLSRTSLREMELTINTCFQRTVVLNLHIPIKKFCFEILADFFGK